MTMNIAPDIAYHEQAVQLEFLRNRILVLAQKVADVTKERDEALADIEGLQRDLVAARSEIEDLIAERREEDAIRETADGASE